MTPFAYDAGALRAVVVGGRVLLAGMYCTTDGFRRIDLRDASTGELLGTGGTGGGEWWREPADHFTTATWQGGTYVLHVTDKPNGYRLLRVTLDGLEPIEYAPEGYDFVGSVAAAVLDGRPAVLTGDFRDAKFRQWGAGDRVLRSWTAPAGWTCSRVLAAGGRSYGWLDHDVPESTPYEERWRVAAEHGRRLWDVAADTPVGPPLLVRGYEWGPWSLGGRPVMLFKVDWRDHQVWDLARREPLGPGLGDLDLANPAVGLLHGRLVLTATAGNELRAWDIRTGRRLGTTELPDAPIATAAGPADTVWAISRSGYVASLTIEVGRIHPSAVRAGGVSPSPRRSPR